MTIYRQGDILIQSIDEIPANVTRVRRDQDAVILAHGEVTGHHHAILDPEAELFESTATADAAERFLRASAPVRLTHQEHGTIVVPPGNYRIVRQREYQPEAPRWVAD